MFSRKKQNSTSLNISVNAANIWGIRQLFWILTVSRKNILSWDWLKLSIKQDNLCWYWEEAITVVSILGSILLKLWIMQLLVGSLSLKIQDIALAQKIVLELLIDKFSIICFKVLILLSRSLFNCQISSWTRKSCFGRWRNYHERRGKTQRSQNSPKLAFKKD